MIETIKQASTPAAALDLIEAVEDLLRSLKTHTEGLSSREAQRRLAQYGPNQLERRECVQWPRELARQLTHPLALLLWMAALLSFIVGSITVGVAVVLIIVLNAAVAFVQERHAVNAVEALAGYIPQKLTVVRDGTRRVIDTAELVPGDIALVEEGERIAADMRLISGAVEVDLSTLAGESVPAMRSAEYHDRDRPRLEARELVFSGSGRGRQAVVFATGMHPELGRIAALLQGVKEEPSPLDQQIRSVSRLIAKIAVALAVAFVPLAIFVTGLSLKSSVTFAVGLLAGMVPEGLLPVITLPLTVAVTLLARRGAVVKRLSSVETLGSTDVICTDKTGTLTENRMDPVVVWTCAGEIRLDAAGRPRAEPAQAPVSALLETAAACNNARLDLDNGREPNGDPTEIAVLQAARALRGDVTRTGASGPAATNTTSTPLPPRLPAGDHDDLPRCDLRADRHRLRGAHPARVAALGRVFSNRYLLWAIAGELAIAAVFVFAPPCQALLGTAVPPGRDLLLLIPFPFIVWGADELRKWVIRSRSSRRAAAVTPAPAA